MNLKIGDRVKYIDDVGGGEVVAIQGMSLTIEDEHGFHFEVNANQVVSEIPGGYSPTFKRTSSAIQMEVEPLPTTDLEGHRRKGKNPFLEIDLHIHHLVSDERHMTNHDMLGVQMGYVNEILTAAKAGKHQKIVFIHGVGNGTLRNEIRTFIAQQNNCECHDASFADYGYGATEVRLWFN